MPRRKRSTQRRRSHRALAISTQTATVLSSSSRQRTPRRQLKRPWISKVQVSLLVALGLLCGSGVWLGRMWLRYQQALELPPDAIVVLGGGVPREIGAAQLALEYPDLDVYISTGSPEWCLRTIFEEQRGIDYDSRIVNDRRAGNTLTNFAAMAPLLSNGAPRKVVLVTDLGNWPRAERLGSIMLGSRGIAMVPATIDGIGSSRGESENKTQLQTGFALAWAAIGDWVLPAEMWNNGGAGVSPGNAQSLNCTDGYNSFVDIRLWEPIE